MKYLLVMFFSVVNTTIWGQLYCINYDVNDGLPSENITAIAEDSQGYMYVGTSLGLTYFDGVDFSIVSDIGKGDLPNNVFVEEIRFDSSGNVWISTEHNGLYRLEVKTNTWTNFSNDNETEFKLPNNTIWDIEVVGDSILVSCESKGVTCINTHTLEVSPHDIFKSSTIADIHKTKDETLIVSTKNAVYRVFNNNARSRIDTLFQTTSRFDIVRSYSLSDGSIYIISYTKGVLKLQDRTLLELIPPEDVDTWRYDFIDEYNGKQWLTLKNYGIASIDNHTNEWKVYESQAFNKNSLLKGKYNVGFKDSRNNLWIGTSNGLSNISPELQAFKSIENKKPTNEFLLEAYYNEKRRQYVMLYASEKNKVKILDEEFNEIAAVNHTPNVKYIQSLWNLTPYKQNYYCLGHDIMYLDGNSHQLTKAMFPGVDTILNPRAITLDEGNNLWIAHATDKVIKYSLSNQRVVAELTLPQLNEDSVYNYNVRRIDDCDKYISIAAKDIFLMIDKESYEINIYDIDKTTERISKIDEYPVKLGSVKSVLYRDGSYFICSRDEGVYKAEYSIETAEFSVTYNLSSKDSFGAVELEVDSNRNVWVASDKGLFITDENLKIKKKIGAQYGLPNTKLSEGLSLVNGNIFLNHRNGFTVVDTKLLNKDNLTWSVDLKRMLVNNESIDVSLGDIELLHTQRNVEIDVSIPYFGNLSSYRYSYRLLPIGEEWKEVELSMNQFRFDNLQADKYQFEIKVVSRNVEGEVTKLPFTIHPPFWLTWWFLILTILLIVFAAIWIYKVRLRYKINEEKVKTRLAELQNEAIRAQLNPHFIFNALNSIRSLILMDRKDSSLDYLGKFSALVREVLSMSKEETISLKRELDFNENYVNIERLRFSQELEYIVTVADEINSNQVNVPPMIMQPFIENAIWHGLLGKVDEAKLHVDIKIEDGWLYISIADNGKGRKVKDVNRLPRYKTKKAYGELLSRQRLQSIGKGADIEILDEKENGKPTGTTVVIKLPLQL